MPKPKVIVALGSCPASGNVFAGSYSVLHSLDYYVPVDVYVPGCSPKPEAIIDGLYKAATILKEKRRGIK